MFACVPRVCVYNLWFNVRCRMICFVLMLCVCVDCVCLVYLCVLFVMYYVAWSAFCLWVLAFVCDAVCLCVLCWVMLVCVVLVCLCFTV